MSLVRIYVVLFKLAAIVQAYILEKYAHITKKDIYEHILEKYVSQK